MTDASAAREVSFPGAGGDAVSALLFPAATPTPHAGLLFLHWGFGNRASFAREAELYAAAGATALCVDAPGYGARKGPRVGAKDAASVRAYAEQLLGDLGRALDFLCEQPGVEPARLGYVGHSLGATIAPAFLARQPRVRAAALLAGTGALSRLWLTSHAPEAERSLEDLDGVRCLARSHASLFLQFGERDEWITRADAEAQIAAASEPKLSRFYACDHAMDASAARDRARWLRDRLALPREPALAGAERLLPRGQIFTYRAIAPFVRLARWHARHG